MEEKILEILIHNYPNFASNGRVAKQIVAEATKEMYPLKFVMWISSRKTYESIHKLFEYWKQNIQGK